MSQHDPILDFKRNVGHCDLYFMVHWFCLISWRLFDVWTSLLGIMSQYDPTFDLKINVGHCDLYFMIEWFCLIFPRLFDGWVPCFQIMRQCDPNFDLKINIGRGLVILLNIFKIIWWMNIIDGIMDQCDRDWPHQVHVYVGQWPIFYGPMILLLIRTTIWWRNIIFRIMDRYDTKIDLVKYMWVIDLYFMVHWFCVLSCHTLELFLYFKNWRRPVVFVPHRHLL